MESRLEELAVALYEARALKFGDFLMKTGVRSPVYFDLRVLVSYPALLESISELLSETLADGDCDLVCGVPYTALPMATVISVKRRMPMLIRRKETKDYGTKKKIEGVFARGDSCAIIEDVITSGSSVLETAADLRAEGLRVERAVVILDREQGGRENLRRNAVSVTSLFTMRSFLSALLKAGKVDEATCESVEKYLAGSKIACSEANVTNNRSSMPFERRLDFAKNPVAKRLFELMCRKKTNLCIAADLTSCDNILNLLESVGPHICMLKLHVDIVDDFSPDFVSKLKKSAERHYVVLMEDRKYGDIGNTASLQSGNGIFRVNEWADVVTVHSLPGAGVLNGLKKSFNETLKGVFVVAQLSCDGNLITPAYTESTMKMVASHADAIAGVVCQDSSVVQDPGLIQLTPGVKLEKSNDDLGQVYNDPEEIMCRKGADIAVVGRGIINAQDVVEEAKKYKEVLWKCYEKRIQ